MSIQEDQLQQMRTEDIDSGSFEFMTDIEVVTFRFNGQTYSATFSALTDAIVSDPNVPAYLWDRARQYFSDDYRRRHPQPELHATVEDYTNEEVSVHESEPFVRNIETRVVSEEAYDFYQAMMGVVRTLKRKPKCSCGHDLEADVIHAERCNVHKYFSRHDMLTSAYWNVCSSVIRWRAYRPIWHEDHLELKSIEEISSIRITDRTRAYVLDSSLIDIIDWKTQCILSTGDSAEVYLAGAKKGVILFMHKMNRDRGCSYMPGFDPETIAQTLALFAVKGYDPVGYIRIYSGLKNDYQPGHLGPVLHEMNENAPGFFLLTSAQDGIEVVTREGMDKALVKHKLFIKDKRKIYLLHSTFVGELKEQMKQLLKVKGGSRHEAYITAVKQATLGCNMYQESND